MQTLILSSNPNVTVSGICLCASYIVGSALLKPGSWHASSVISTLECIRHLLPHMLHLASVSLIALLLSPTTSMSGKGVILWPQHLGGSCTSCKAQAAFSNRGCVTELVVSLCYACDMQYTQQYSVLGNLPCS